MRRTLDHLDATDIAALAQLAGTTPFFAIDGAAVEKRVRQLRALLPARTLICFAIKANPMPASAGKAAPVG
jgi:diaminopimelate decarboxylase